MRNLRISDTYQYIFLASQPKTSFSTGEVIQGSFRVEVLMIDPLIHGEKPVQISVTIPHEIDDYEVGKEIFFLDITCTFYKFDTGRSGLSWKAERAGTSDDIYAFENGVIA